MNEQNIGIQEFVNFLSEDINYILFNLKLSESQSFFEVKHFELWSTRLYCRCIILSAFKKICKENIKFKDINFDLITNNIFLTHHLNSIVKELEE